jgi:hypothetical protein
MASLQINAIRSDVLQQAADQLSGIAANHEGRVPCDVTIDFTASKITLTDNTESRTGYPKMWVYG